MIDNTQTTTTDINNVQYEQAMSFLGKLIEYVDDVDAILRDVANHYDADRAYVFEFSGDGKTIDNTYEWCKEGVSPEIGNLQNIPYESVAVWVEEFERLGAFSISSLDKDVEANSLTYEILEPQGIDSLIAAPIYKDNKIIGFIGVDNPRINTNDVVILKTTASILYSEISRKIAKQNQTIKDMTSAQLEQMQKLKKALEDKKEYYDTLGALGDIFYSIHVIDLTKDSVVEFSAKNEVKEMVKVNKRTGATALMKNIISAVTADEYKESALEFTDLNTVSERMRNKTIMSEELVGIHIGWFLASFITMERDNDGKPTKVIYTTRIIDEEKKQKEKLIKKTQTDEMTGLFNRRAYEEKIYEHNDIPEEDKFIYISLDANGLKVINDTKGHTAGDEMLIGVSQCMKKCLGPFGHLYRIGGDEFVAILFCDETEIKDVLADFDNAIDNWKGELIDKISVSYGWINKYEDPNASTRQLGAIAEARMYEAKNSYYRKMGIDRRGQRDAHTALCELYTKILGINITTDTYQIINMDKNEQTSDKGFADKISDWLVYFGKTGQVHPEDLEEYLRLTDIEYLRDYFKGDKTSLSIFYRRKYEDGFKKVMMEIIPAKDYTDDYQSLFLYVKNIDK